jgi:hypothetical protein
LFFVSTGDGLSASAPPSVEDAWKEVKRRSKEAKNKRRSRPDGGADGSGSGRSSVSRDLSASEVFMLDEELSHGDDDAYLSRKSFSNYGPEDW